MNTEDGKIIKRTPYGEYVICALEETEEYKRILPDLETAVYREFVKLYIRTNSPKRVRNSELVYVDGTFEIEGLEPVKEKTPEELNKEIERVNTLTGEELMNEVASYSKLGSCHTIWSIKKRILKEKYGMDWLSPADLHPDIIFD